MTVWKEGNWYGQPPGNKYNSYWRRLERPKELINSPSSL
jgi:hypothetical protein